MSTSQGICARFVLFMFVVVWWQSILPIFVRVSSQAQCTGRILLKQYLYWSKYISYKHQRTDDIAMKGMINPVIVWWGILYLRNKPLVLGMMGFSPWNHLGHGLLKKNQFKSMFINKDSQTWPLISGQPSLRLWLADIWAYTQSGAMFSNMDFVQWFFVVQKAPGYK